MTHSCFTKNKWSVLEKSCKDVFGDNYCCQCYVKLQAQPLDKKRQAYPEPGKQQPWLIALTQGLVSEPWVSAGQPGSSVLLGSFQTSYSVSNVQVACLMLIMSVQGLRVSLIFLPSIHLHFQVNEGDFSGATVHRAELMFQLQKQLKKLLEEC